MSDPTSERLVFRRPTVADVSTFHALAIDEHIRKYLLDDEVMDESWSRQTLADHVRNFADHGWGLWLLYRDDEAIGFAGFHTFEELGPTPQLLYALTEPHTGQGLATEIGQALIEYATVELGWPHIDSAVDAPNLASLRVLEKLGFRITERRSTGAFGETVFLRHP